VEADWLEAAQDIDRMYHGAKLTAAAFAEPERIWSEHERVRSAILGAHVPIRHELSREEWLARVAAIDRKMRQAGLVPHSGEMH
jgi:hypothetical protein